MRRIRIDDPAMVKYVESLEALAGEARTNGELRECVVAIAHTLHRQLKHFPDADVNNHLFDMHMLVRGIAADISGDMSLYTKKTLIRGFRLLMKWYNCTVRVTDNPPPQPPIGGA